MEQESQYDATVTDRVELDLNRQIIPNLALHGEPIQRFLLSYHREHLPQEHRTRWDDV